MVFARLCRLRLFSSYGHKGSFPSWNFDSVRQNSRSLVAESHAAKWAFKAVMAEFIRPRVLSTFAWDLQANDNL